MRSSCSSFFPGIFRSVLFFLFLNSQGKNIMGLKLWNKCCPGLLCAADALVWIGEWPLSHLSLTQTVGASQAVPGTREEAWRGGGGGGVGGEINSGSAEQRVWKDGGGRRVHAFYSFCSFCSSFSSFSSLPLITPGQLSLCSFADSQLPLECLKTAPLKNAYPQGMWGSMAN